MEGPKFNSLKRCRMISRPAFSIRTKPPYGYVMMFKVLILQRLYNLCEDDTS